MRNKWNSMNEKEKNIFEIVIVLIMVVLFIAYKLYSNYADAKRASVVSSETHLVTDNSRYFTVIGCVEKYITTIKSGNKNNILTILDSKYKEEYNIEKNNLKNYIPNLNGDKIYSYSGREMYEKRISKNVVVYYVYGNIEESVLDEIPTGFEYNLTVTLYESEFLFSIKPGVNI